VKEDKKFYITTPIYYVNAKPHIGHAYTTIAADVLARFQKLQGKEVFFLTGTDEHGLKIQKKAEEAGKDPQQFVNEIEKEFKSLWKKLGIGYDNFIRTTNEEHKKAVQKVLETLKEKQAIEKGSYSGLYCEGCEQFKNDGDLVDGKCPDHNIKAEKVEEECWILKMKVKQPELEEKIKSDEFKIRPEKHKNEVLSFLKNNKLKNISISRKNVEWGIPLPFDEKHTTYVWVDAFLNYLTGLGWDGDLNKIPDRWPVNVQLLGKDIMRVHTTIWPIILLYLGLELPKQLYVHGHLLSGGKKMSKTLGNVITIEEMLEKFGVDGTRYLILSAGTFGEDVDVTMERLTEKYNADLANGIGNLVSRVLKLAEDILEWSGKEIIKSVEDKSKKHGSESFTHIKNVADHINKMQLDIALSFINKRIQSFNKQIEDEKPWELKKNDRVKFENVMGKLLEHIALLALMLKPFMPETAEKIKKALEAIRTDILFQRIK